MGVVCWPVGKLFGTRARATATIAALAVVVVAGAGVVYGSIPDSGGIIHGCYKSNGQLRLINPATSGCDPSETPLAWNRRARRVPWVRKVLPVRRAHPARKASWLLSAVRSTLVTTKA